MSEGHDPSSGDDSVPMEVDKVPLPESPPPLERIKDSGARKRPREVVDDENDGPEHLPPSGDLDPTIVAMPQDVIDVGEETGLCPPTVGRRKLMVHAVNVVKLLGRGAVYPPPPAGGQLSYANTVKAFFTTSLPGALEAARVAKVMNADGAVESNAKITRPPSIRRTTIAELLLSLRGITLLQRGSPEDFVRVVLGENRVAIQCEGPIPAWAMNLVGLFIVRPLPLGAVQFHLTCESLDFFMYETQRRAVRLSQVVQNQRLVGVNVRPFDIHFRRVRVENMNPHASDAIIGVSGGTAIPIARVPFYVEKSIRCARSGRGELSTAPDGGQRLRYSVYVTLGAATYRYELEIRSRRSQRVNRLTGIGTLTFRMYVAYVREDEDDELTVKTYAGISHNNILMQHAISRALNAAMPAVERNHSEEFIPVRVEHKSVDYGTWLCCAAGYPGYNTLLIWRNAPPSPMGDSGVSPDGLASE